MFYNFPFFVLLVLTLIANRVKSQELKEYAILQKLNSAAFEFYEQSNYDDSTYIIAFDEGEYNDSKRIYYNTSIKIVCLNKRCQVQWISEMPIDPDQKIYKMIHHGNLLVFISRGYNKLTYEYGKQSVMGTIVQYFDPITKKTIEYYINEKPYGLADSPSAQLVLTKVPSNNKDRIVMRSLKFEQSEGKIIEGKPLSLSENFLNSTMFNHTFKYLDKSNSIMYVIPQVDKKNNSIKDSAASFLGSLVYKSEKLYLNGKDKISKSILSGSVLEDFKVLNDETSIGIGSDKKGSFFFTYNYSLMQRKDIQLSTDRYTYKMFSYKNEVLIIGMPQKTSKMTLTYISDGKIVWVKTKEVQKKTLVYTCIFNKTEIEILYLNTNVDYGNGEIKSELRNFELIK